MEKIYGDIHKRDRFTAVTLSCRLFSALSGCKGPIVVWMSKRLGPFCVGKVTDLGVELQRFDVLLSVVEEKLLHLLTLVFPLQAVVFRGRLSKKREKYAAACF